MNSPTIDLCFQTTNRATLEAALTTLGLLHRVTQPDGAVLTVCIDEHVMLDYIGLIVSEPAKFGPSANPANLPVMITAATHHPGERAALRLTGPLAASRAAAIAAASMQHTVLLDPAAAPAGSVRWAS